MVIADSRKTWQPPCSAQVFQTHMNWLPGNTLITSQVLPITKFQISSCESCKKRIGEKLWLLDKACPSTSSQLQRTLGKSVPSVETQTTPCKTTGPGGRIWIKKAKDNQSPKSLICLEKRRWTKRGRAKKRHQRVPMYYLYWIWPICPYKWHNQLIFLATRWEKVEWCLDSECTDHITPSKSDFV